MGLSLFSPYVLIGIVIAVLGAYGAGRGQQFHRDEIRWTKKVDAMVQKAEAEKAAEEQRRQRAVTATEAAQAAKEQARVRQLADAQARVKNLSAALAATRVTDVAWVLNTAISESAGATGPAAKPDKNTAAAAANSDTTIGLWAQWSVTCINLYASARDQIVGWNEFYKKLQARGN